MQGSLRDAIEWVTSELLRTMVDEHRIEAVAPEAVTLLLRQYAATGREDCHALAGRLLAQALAADLDSPEWLETFVEAAALSDDERLREAIIRAAEAQRRRWPAHAPIDRAARSVDAGL